jgi:hypothetical protein
MAASTRPEADEKLADARAKIAERVENGRPDRDAPVED